MEEKRRKLVLKVGPNRRVTAGDFIKFLEAIGQYNIAPTEEVEVTITVEGDIKFGIPIPPAIPLPRSPMQRAADKQIAQRAKAVAEGEEVTGYVPPVHIRKKVRVPVTWKAVNKKR